MNHYNLPKIGLANGVILAFLGTSPRLFLQSFSEQVSINAQAAWIGILLNSLITILVIYILLLLIQSRGTDLIVLTKNLLGSWIAQCITLLFSLMFLGNAALLLREYVESTQLTALPEADFHLISFFFSVVVGVAVYLGLEAISRAGLLVLPLLVVGSVAVLGLLYPFYQFYHLVPVLGNGINPILTAGIRGIGYNMAALSVLIMAGSFQNARTARLSVILGLLCAMLLKVIYSLTFIAVMGTEVGSEKILPFYELSRLVFINRYLQRIEALFTVIWAIVGIIAIAMSLYTACYLLFRFLKLTTLKPLVPLLAVLTLILSILPTNFDKVISYEGLLLNLETIVMLTLPLLLLAVHFIKGKKRICSSV